MTADTRDPQGPAGQPAGPDAGEPEVVEAEVVETAGAEETVEPEDPRGVDELKAALAEAERLRDDYLDQLRRARADYENLSRRKTRELMDALDRGAAQLLSALLPILDIFDMALDSARSSDDERLVKGVGMVHTGLLDVLQQAGLEQVPGTGEPFDPRWHEALTQVESEEPVEEPTVAEVLRSGYRFKGRVLRPASVSVTG
ncbi:MAG: nucleotide exchange factor GrpE [Egibacteraceae bacterium]